MKHIIISATNRPEAKTFLVSNLLQKIYHQLDCPAEILSLKDICFQNLVQKPYSKPLPKEIQQPLEKLNQATGLTIVCPEYNGSFPGIFKFFIDHWSYPQTFKHRPIAFVGLGGRFGGLRAIEHVHQIMGALGAFIYPEKVFLQNISSLLSKDGELKDKHLSNLLHSQTKGFLRFITALKQHNLTASP